MTSRSFVLFVLCIVVSLPHEALSFQHVQLRGVKRDSSTAVITPLAGGSPYNPSLFGLNDVLGPVIQIPYDSPVLVDIVQSLRVGLLRHPGGTVADYWNITSGRYATTCNTSTCNQFRPLVNKFPLGTFSPKNFVDGLARYTAAGLPVFDLNVLTMDESTFASQVDQIKPLCAEQRCIVELGNELNLNPYRWKFPNAEAYMNTCKPLVERLRQQIPHVIISAVGGGIQSFSSVEKLPWSLNNDELDEMRTRKADEESWRQTLVQYRHLFDAVTIHDYTSDRSLLAKYDNATSTTIVATWPEVIYEKAQLTCRQLYNDNIIILITEYNQALNGGKGSQFAEDHRNSGVHAMNTLSHIMAGVTYGRTIQAMQYHAMLSVEGIGWDSSSGITHLNSESATSASVNGASQVFAHTSAIGSQYTTMHGASIKSGPKIDDDFPVSILRGLSCLQAVFFANKTEGTFAVINRCNSPVVAQLNTSGWVSSAKGEQSAVSVTTYDCSPALLGGWVPMPDTDTPFPWPGPVPSAHKSANVGDDVTLPPFSFSLITLS